MKRYISLVAALLCLGLFNACGRGYTPMPPVEETMSTTITETETESESAITEAALEETEAAAEGSAVQASATTTTAPAVKISATTAKQSTTATTAKASSAATTTACTTTTRAPTTTTAPPVPTTTQTNPPAPVYTQADYDAIIKAVRDHAEAKTQVRFIWKPDLHYKGPAVGFHDVVNLTKSSGKEFVINELKYHVNLTETHVAGGSGGVPGDAVYYNVEYFDYQGDLMWVLVYG